MSQTSLGPQSDAATRKRTGALIVGLLTAALAGASLFALNNLTDTTSASPVGARDGSTNETTGSDYAAEIGLVRHEFDPATMKLESQDGVLVLNGTPLEGCAKPTNGDVWAMKVISDGGLYCFSASSEIDLWVVSQRLSGHVPTEEEVADRQTELESALQP